MSWGVHWFRRDLRVFGNPGLQHQWKLHHGKVLGVFFFDSKFLARPDFSHTRFAFFLQSLRALKQDLQKSGGDLLVLDARFLEAWQLLLQNVTEPPALITWCRDYEPYARSRDEQVEKFLQEKQISYESFRDHLLLEPPEVLKDDSSSYSVYSPFARKWFEKLATSEVQSRLRHQISGWKQLAQNCQTGEMPSLFQARWEDYWPESLQRDALDRFEKENSRSVKISLPPAGSRAAAQCVQEFARKIEDYEGQRDFPAELGTSRFSIYLKNGSLVSSQIVHALKLENENWKQKTSRSKFLKEIVWREFYYSILWHHPRVEAEAFQVKYKDLAWENREDWFAAWQEGCTGFPIIDAGMRQLLQEGWMHNRVRMIVASFLTKDLLIDWRWGERHFMQHLLDGDIAPNNGGWQWAASTGCDPQPYFRIFNPLLQSQKFDPEGRYIKKYIPELRALSIDEVHAPTNPKAYGYPPPLVEHHEQKAKALALFQALRSP